MAWNEDRNFILKDRKMWYMNKNELVFYHFRNNSLIFGDNGVIKGTAQELRVKDRYIHVRA